MRRQLVPWLLVASGSLALLSVLTTRAVRAQIPLSVSGSPAPLAVSSAAAGDLPLSINSATTTYTVTLITVYPLKVTGQLNASMPSGVTLTATLAAPPNATSLGAVALSTTPQDLVTNIILLAISTRSITYQLRATPAAGVVPSQSRTVTFTLTVAP